MSYATKPLAKTKFANSKPIPFPDTLSEAPNFVLVVAKSRACPTPTVGAGHARRSVSLAGFKGESPCRVRGDKG
jgi:hypothetical protein